MEERKTVTKVQEPPLLSAQTRTARGLSPGARGVLELLFRAGIALTIYAMQIVAAPLAVPGDIAGVVLLRRHLEDRAHVVQL